MFIYYSYSLQFIKRNETESNYLPAANVTVRVVVIGAAVVVVVVVDVITHCGGSVGLQLQLHTHDGLWPFVSGTT